MSVIAKILIVLNLLLAVVFLGASATFLGQQESWKKKHDDLAAQKKLEIDDLTAQRDAATQRAREQEGVAGQKQAEVQELQATLAAKEADYQQITERFGTLTGQYERLSQTYKDAVAQNEDLTKRLNDAINDKDTALTEKRAAIDAQNAAVTERKRLEGEVENLQGQVAELNKRLVAMGEELESTKILVEAYQSQVGSLPDLMNPPTIRARVTAVDADLNIVMISVGSDDGVKKGYAFTVYRGDQYIGKVIIDKVEKDYASGYSKKELEADGQTIQVGDDATTRF